MKKIVKRLFIIVLGVFLIFSIVSIIIIKNVYDKNFIRVDRPDYSITAGNVNYNEFKNEYPRSNVSFLSGKNKLAGYIYGEENNKGLIVLAHGLGGGSDSYLPQIMFFIDNGYKLFAYDLLHLCHVCLVPFCHMIDG